MTIEPFSRRYGFRPTPEGLINNNVPQRVRVGFLGILHTIARRMPNGALVIQRKVCYSLLERKWSSTSWDQVEKLIYRCSWPEFYDVCQAIYEYLLDLKEESVMTAPQFENELNLLLSEEGMAYKMSNGGIKPAGTPFTDRQLHEVRQLLRDPQFEGPNMHFEKAIAFLSQRPPDTENCVKEAALALEAVGKKLSGEEKESFGTIYKKHFKAHTPKPLNQLFESYWGYASGEGGIRHASTDGTRVPVEEAEFCLVQAASMIRYLIQKFGKLQEPF